VAVKVIDNSGNDNSGWSSFDKLRMTGFIARRHRL